MEEKFATFALASILILVLIFPVASDINQDKAKCTNQLIGLATCLPYVSGETKMKMPTPDCCTGLNEVMSKSKECVCILINDRDDPGLGLKFNVSLVLTLPIKCHSQDPNLSECPALLHLPPNSPNAKVFDDFARSLEKLRGNNSTSNATAANANGTSAASVNGSTANEKSQGQRRNQFQSEMVWGLLIVVFFTSIMVDVNA